MKQWSLQGKLCFGEEWKKYSGSRSLIITVLSLVFGKIIITSNSIAPIVFNSVPHRGFTVGVRMVQCLGLCQ